MDVIIIPDKNAQTDLSNDLYRKIINVLRAKGYGIDLYELDRDEIFQCLGCLLCLTKHPNECVNKDMINDIRRKAQHYGATFFITPVVFGHYSSTIASAINRGAGSHHLQFIIGYGEDISAEEKSTFIDLTARHRGKADIVHPGMDERVEVFVTMGPEDNGSISEAVSRAL